MKRLSLSLTTFALLAFMGSLIPAALQAQVEQQQREQQQSADSIVGTISERQNGTLVVETEDGQQRSFQVDEQTRVVDRTGQTIEEQQNPLEALESGENVVIHYRTGEEPTEYIATSIRLGEPGQAAQQQQQQQQQDQQDRMQAQQQNDLPATSGSLPLVAGLGLLGLVAAMGLGLTARREN